MSSDQLWKEKPLTCLFSQSGPDKPLIEVPCFYLFTSLSRQHEERWYRYKEKTGSVKTVRRESYNHH